METIKDKFGKAFWAARKAKQFSRAELAMRIGVSPKTIQSWENGRTFVEKLDIIPLIEKELGVPFSKLIQQSTSDTNISTSSHRVFQQHCISLPLLATRKNNQSEETISLCIPNEWLETKNRQLAVLVIDDPASQSIVRQGGIVIVNVDCCVPESHTSRLYAIQIEDGSIEFHHISVKSDRLRFCSQPAPSEIPFPDISNTEHKILGCVVGIIGQPC